MAINAVKLTRKFTNDVEFSCEDTARTDIDDICRMVEAVIKTGATTVNLPDTVGYAIPRQFSKMITQVMNRVTNIDQAIISVHCHNDLGMDTANSLACIQAGARQIECTINGIGERAGNCALEEIVMALEVRKDYFNIHNNINLDQIYRTSQIVSHICNVPIQPNKAIVGSNAFSNSSGIHQDGMLKAKNTYEIMSPETIGIKPIGLNLTSRSGSAAVKSHMSNMGYKEDQDYSLEELYRQFKDLADKKGQIFDYDLDALAFVGIHNIYENYQLIDMSVNAHSKKQSTASVNMKVGDKTIIEAAVGNGPIDAIYACIKRISAINFDLLDYKITSKSQGEDALGQVDIVIQHQNRKFHGIGLDTDILNSSAKALIKALDAVYIAQKVTSIRQQ